MKLSCYKEYIEKENQINESVTISQSLNSIVKGQNQIFNKEGGLNKDFLINLRLMNNSKFGNFGHKCYDTQFMKQFDRLLQDKINRINN